MGLNCVGDWDMGGACRKEEWKMKRKDAMRKVDQLEDYSRGTGGRWWEPEFAKRKRKEEA